MVVRARRSRRLTSISVQMVSGLRLGCMVERNRIAASGGEHMPASAHTLADGESACVNALARMCKEVWGGHPGRVVVRERARAHPSSSCCRQCVIASSQGGKARVRRRRRREGEGEGASSFSRCREGKGASLSG